MLNAIPNLETLGRKLEPPRKVDKRYGLESIGRRIDTLKEMTRENPQDPFLEGMKESLEAQWARLSSDMRPENPKRIRINPESKYDLGYVAAAEWVFENYR